MWTWRRRLLIIGTPVLMAAVAVGTWAAIAGTSARAVGEKVEIGESKQVNDVTVTLISAEIVSDGLAVKYSYKTSTGVEALQLGVPAIVDQAGTRTETFRGGVPVEDQAQIDLFRWPPDGTHLGQLSDIDLGSFVVFDETLSGSATIVVGPKISSLVDGDSGTNSSIALNVPISVGGRQYQISELTVDWKSATNNFKLVVVPQDDLARHTELASGPANVTLSDDNGDSYKWIGTRTHWATETGDHEVGWQQLMFEGAPSASSTQFLITITGAGNVAGPFVFEGIALP